GKRAAAAASVLRRPRLSTDAARSRPLGHFPLLGRRNDSLYPSPEGPFAAAAAAVRHRTQESVQAKAPLLLLLLRL
ncbi:unnamed protein product, partial [Urochloa humidicola]